MNLTFQHGPVQQVYIITLAKQKTIKPNNHQSINHKEEGSGEEERMFKGNIKSIGLNSIHKRH